MEPVKTSREPEQTIMVHYSRCLARVLRSIQSRVFDVQEPKHQRDTNVNGTERERERETERDRETERQALCLCDRCSAAALEAAGCSVSSGGATSHGAEERSCAEQSLLAGSAVATAFHNAATG